MANSDPGKEFLKVANKAQNQFESAVQEAIDTALKEVHTCLPAVVTKVNTADQLIDCQLTIKRKLKGQLVLLPILVNVPVRYPRSNTFSITFPLEVDDHVMIIFAERSIDVWLQEGGIQNPFDVRRHSLSDAFAIPMMYPQTDTIPDFDETDLQIKTNTGSTKITVKASEGIDIFSTGNVDITCANININCNFLDIGCSTLDVNAVSGVDITTPLVDVTGDLTVSGTITGNTVDATSSLTVDGQEQGGHVHEQGDDGDGDSEQDTGPPKDGP